MPANLEALKETELQKDAIPPEQYCQRELQGLLKKYNCSLVATVNVEGIVIPVQIRIEKNV